MSFGYTWKFGHIPRAPVDGFSRWLQKQRMQKALGSKRSIIDVVCSKVPATFARFTFLVTPNVAGGMQSEWDQKLEWAADEGDVPRWTDKAVWRTCDPAVDFYRRLVYPCSTFPRLLLWLAYRPHDERCSHRQECAANLVGMAELAAVDELGYDQTALKFVRMFLDELRTTAQTGTISLPLHQIMKAPSIAWELLSDRLALKKTLAHELHNVSALPHFLDLCVEKYDKAIEKKIASDANITRLNVVDMPNYSSPCTLDQGGLEKTKRKTHAIVQVRLFLHSLGLEFVPTVDAALCSTVTAADADLVLSGENSTVWLFVHQISQWVVVREGRLHSRQRESVGTHQFYLAFARHTPTNRYWERC